MIVILFQTQQCDSSVKRPQNKFIFFHKKLAQTIIYSYLCKELKNNIMNLETGFFLQNGTQVKYGDVLSSDSTKDVVVMYDEVNRVPVAKLVGEHFSFPLNEFMVSWGKIVVIKENIIILGAEKNNFI